MGHPDFRDSLVGRGPKRLGSMGLMGSNKLSSIFFFFTYNFLFLMLSVLKVCVESAKRMFRLIHSQKILYLRGYFDTMSAVFVCLAIQDVTH